MTHGMYVEVLRRYVPAIRENYPNCRIVGVMARAELDAKNESALWREAILTDAGDLVDVIQVQNYGFCGARPEDSGDYRGGVEDPVEQVRRLADQLSDFETSTRTCIESFRSRGIKANVGVAEWNWWMQASHWDGRDFEEPPLTLHGLFVSGMIHRFAEMAPDFEVAHFYNLVNCMGIVNRRNADVETTCVAEVFKLYRPAFPGALRTTNVEAAALGTGKSVEALCIARDADTWLFLVNRDPNEAVEVEVPDFAIGTSDIVCLCGKQTTDVLTIGAASVRDNFIVLPPLSIVRCRNRQE